MALSKEDRQRITDAIDGRVKGWQCRLCDQNDWTLAEGIIALGVQDKPGTVVVGGRVLPCIALTCSNCGNTLLLNMVMLGLRDMVEKHEEEEKKTPKES